MKIKNQQLKEFILDSDLVQKEALETAFVEAERAGAPLGTTLLEKKLLSETDLQKLYAYILGIPFIDLSKEAISSDILHIIPEPIAKKSHVVAFEKAGANLKVAMLNPEDVQTIDFIRKKTGLKRDDFLSKTEEYLRQAIADWINGNQPFTARLNPDYPGYTDYDQLMRLDEWQARADSQPTSGATEGEKR